MRYYYYFFVILLLLLYPLTSIAQSSNIDISKIVFSEEKEHPNSPQQNALFHEKVEAGTDKELYKAFSNISQNMETRECEKDYQTFIHLLQIRSSAYKGYLWTQAYMLWFVIKGETAPKDSIMFYCNQLKQKAMDFKTPIDAFMRSWTLAILKFSNQRYDDEAYSEAQLMIKVAKQHHFTEGLIYANELVVRMLRNREQWELSLTYLNEMIRLTKALYKQENNRSIPADESNYYTYGFTLTLAFISRIQAKHYKEALNMLPDIERRKTADPYCYLWYAKGLLYCATNNHSKYQETVELYKKKLDADSLLTHPEKAGNKIIAVYHYYEIQAKHYLNEHNYTKALEFCQIMDEIRPNPKLTAQTLLGAKQYAEAAELYKQLYHNADSLRYAADSSSISKYAAFMDNENLQLKYLHAQMENQKSNLKISMTVTIALLTIILIGAIFVFKNKKLTRRLRTSQHKLQIQNKELIQKENEITIALHHAEEANQIKSSFLMNVSHEIRTPLNGILGFAQMLPTTTAEEKIMAREICNNCDSLLQLSNNVISMSDYDTDSKTLEYKDIDLNSLLDIVAESFNFDTSLISLNIHLPQTVFSFRSNEEALINLLRELVHNAIKFTAKGKIDIGYEADEQFLYIYVQDTGKGIPADKVKWIFERFNKIDEFVPGFGLGLPLTDIIAHRLHGEIKLDTNYTEGARFVVTLPR